MATSGALSLNASNTDINVSAPKRSEIWFEDGNVILQVSNKQYKVHRGVLATHSPVFKDMFGVPQPAAQLSVEGCPIVELADLVDDWDEFLPVLYNQRRSTYMRTHAAKSYAMPIKLMIAMLVLGHKYNFRIFWDQALQFLKTCFPPTLGELEELWFDAANDEDDFFSVIIEELFRIVNVCHELEIQTALPAAYYMCITHATTESILKGANKPDGPVFLTQNLIHKLILAKEWGYEYAVDSIFHWLPNLKPDCAASDTCKCNFAIWFGFLVAWSAIWRFIALEPRIQMPKSHLCDICCTSFENYFKEVRQDVFTELPTHFNLPERSALRDPILE